MTTLRVRFKVDSVHSNSQHTDYVRDDKGLPLKSQPIVIKTATLNLSAADPGNDPERKHENSQVWKGRASGRLVLSDVDEAVIEKLKGGHESIVGQELLVEISLEAPAVEQAAVVPSSVGTP